jgi:hypothetical protein
MNNTNKIITAAAVGAVAIFALVALVDVDVSGDMEVPNVDMVGGNIEMPSIETSGGEMPAVDVNTADVEVGTESRTVDVPTDVNVETEERTIEYPTIDIDTPEENTRAEEDDL